MINIFNLSISIPNIYQVIAILLTGLNIFVIFLLLEKHDKGKKLLIYVLFFFVAQICFIFLWRFNFGENIKDFNDFIRTIDKLDNMYDVLSFNIVFFIIIFVKYKTSLFTKKDIKD